MQQSRITIIAETLARPTRLNNKGSTHLIISKYLMEFPETQGDLKSR